MDPQDIIRILGMQPHPEGGWYKETFRDPAGGGRGHSTAIYYLLQAGERSHWHRVRDAAEVWHYHAGDPLRLRISLDGVELDTVMLGPDILEGERPQAIVPAGAWQAAETLGAYTLVGCTVAPGFDFAAFEMAPPGWEPGSGCRQAGDREGEYQLCGIVGRPHEVAQQPTGRRGGADQEFLRCKSRVGGNKKGRSEKYSGIRDGQRGEAHGADHEPIDGDGHGQWTRRPPQDEDQRRNQDRQRSGTADPPRLA